jgi:hypothetical protein
MALEHGRAFGMIENDSGDGLFGIEHRDPPTTR